MKISKIGIVGNGFVGSSIYKNFSKKYEVKIYDSIKEKSFNSLNEVLECEVIFVCLPTPMRTAEGSECNLQIINNFFNSLPNNLKALLVLKSTVPVGTTSTLKQKRKDLKIVHNPEFLTALNAENDFKNSYRNIIGDSDNNHKILLELFKDYWPESLNLVVSEEESEMIKYFANTYLATKVTFFNLVYEMCEKFSLDYEKVRTGICSDTRIGFSHTNVPGLDGEKGFGGACFPKDINALIHTLKDNKLDSKILEEIWNYNKKIRKNWDWKYNKSAIMN